MSRSDDRSIATMQEARHGEGFDYEPGSPHLRHPTLRNQIIDRIRELVADQFRRTGRCRVLEIGAGHGSFTDHIAATGAEVTVTEMSRPSLDLLEQGVETLRQSLEQRRRSLEKQQEILSALADCLIKKRS